MAVQAQDPSAPLPPPPFVPVDQTGVSPAWINSGEQVGYGPMARYQNDPNTDSYGLAPDRLANQDAPANFLQMLNPSPVSATRPTDRPGIVPGIGGLIRPEDTTYMPGNVVSQRALAAFPPAIAGLYANRKIDRPSNVGDLYGPGTMSTGGGYYDPSNGTIALARGNADEYGSPNVDIGGAQHEILHAISSEVEPFRQDANTGYPTLKGVITQELPALAGNPQTHSITQKVLGNINANDWGHVFTELGTAYVNGVPLPPMIRAYFDGLKDPNPPNRQGQPF